MFRTSARRWSDILLRKKRMSARGRRGWSRARKGMPRYLGSIFYCVIIALYWDVGLEISGASLSPPGSLFRSDTRNTRKNLAGNAREVWGTVGSLCRGRSMQIRHEISLIVVCRMTEPGNRPFCGSGSDRPKTATRRRCRGIGGVDRAL